MKTDKFLRNDDYYLYWQAIHDAGIKYEYSFEERYWIKQNPYMFPLDDKLKYGSIVKYRLINRLPDEPEPNTQEYLDFWDAKKKVGIILDRFGDKKLEWYKNTGMPSDFQAKFALWKINKTDKITSKDTDKAEVADSSAWTHRNLNKENKMSKEFTLTKKEFIERSMNGEDYNIKRAVYNTISKHLNQCGRRE